MRRTPGSQCEDLTRERDGWDALSGRNARAVQRTIAGDHFQRRLAPAILRYHAIGATIHSGDATPMTAVGTFFNLYNHGFIRVAVGVPEVQVADPEFNAAKTIGLMEQAAAEKAVLALFPE